MSTDERDGDRVPVTPEHHDHVGGPFLHGTRALLAPGAELVPGRASNFQPQRLMRHVYFTTLESTAAWGAQLASALAGDDERGHVYVVEPLGPFEDDPNVTDKKLPGNPTESYRSRHPLRVVRELEQWTPHPPEDVRRMLDGLASLRERGLDVIED
ncbi:NAD(+)--rifampin ADP-ribosyltransferase [Angustibacter aerolatus]